MRGRIAILFIWVFSFGNFFAQDKTLDSLKLALKKVSALKPSPTNDTLKARIISELSQLSDEKESDIYTEQLFALTANRSETEKAHVKAFKRYLAHAYNNKGIYFMKLGATDSALYHLNKSLDLRRQINDKDGLAVSFSNIATTYKRNGNSDKALEYNKMALKVEEEIGDIKIMAVTLNNIALIYTNQSNTAEALNYLFRSLKLRESLKDTFGISNVYLNLGVVYNAQDDRKNALLYYLKALAIRKHSDGSGLAPVLVNLGKLHTRYDQLDSALFYLNGAISNAKEANDKKYLVNALNGIGTVYFKKNELDSALKYFEEGMKESERINSKESLATIYSNLGNIYFKKNQIDKAETYAKISLKSSQELGYPQTIFFSSDLLYKIYKRQNKYQDALLMHELSIKMKDSVDNEQSRRAGIQKQFQYEYEKKSAADSLKTAEEKKVTVAQLKQEKTQRYALYSGLGLVALFAVFMLNRFRVTNRQKQIIEIKEQETQHQKKVVEEKNKEITDSITYAKRIQEAILPPQDFVNEYLPDNFILYKPKDLVAGDFYWMEVVEDKIFIAAADSTGHGVPGALVSVVCSNALNRALKEFNLQDTGKLLDKTRELVLETFAKSSEQVKDGMDISLLCIDKKNNTAFWSGANNPLWKISENNLQEIKADKQPIGKTDHPKPFTTHTIQIKSGDIFYLFTDGFADQFGGEKGKKFKYQQLKDLLVNLTNTPLNEQSKFLSKKFEDWKGKLEQVDDVCIIGIKI